MNPAAGAGAAPPGARRPFAGAALAFRLAWREMRGAARGFWTFLACLALGVGAVAAVGSTAEAFRAGVAAQSALILGGDVEVSRPHLAASPGEQAYLARLGRVSAILDFRAMAWRETPDAQARPKRLLTSLKAVDDAYPLEGRVELDPPQPLTRALEQRDGLYGAVAHPDLLLRLGVRVGDVIGVGDGRFVIRAALAHEPDRAFRLLAFGPRLLVSRAGVEQTGLVAPGSLIRYAYRVALPPGADADGAAGGFALAFPEGGWRSIAAREAAPSLRESFDRLGSLLALAGLAALALGGLGVSAAVDGHLRAKTRSIAVYKALGAPAGLIFTVFFSQIAVLGAIGVAVGLLFGVALSTLALPALAQVLPVSPRPGLYPVPLAVAGAFGLLTAMGFAVIPLSARLRVSAQTLFRGYADPARPRPTTGAVAVAGLLLASACLLVLVVTPDRRLGWGFLGAVAASALSLSLAGRLVVRLAKAAPRVRDARLGLALRALARPDGTAPRVVAGLGLGLTALTTVALCEANFRHALQAEIPEHAPAFFFLDVQPRQLEAFRRTLTEIPGVTAVETAPSIRGRIVSVKGVPARELDVAPSVAWALRGDRSLTVSGPMPQNAKLTAGTWWPPGYAGPPLCSLDADVAAGLGIGVGDTVGVTVLGREITLTVASLRRINWLSLALNHVFVLSPGTLDQMPVSHLATAYVDTARPDVVAQVYERMTGAFPGVNVQRVDEALADVDRVAGQIAWAVRACAGVTLLAGLLVLAQNMAAALSRRIYEAVLFKVCGATRADVLAVLLTEHALAGLAAGAAALALGCALSWFFVSRALGITWRFFPGPAFFALAGGAVLALGLSLAGVRRVLGRKAWPYLRNE